MVQNSGEFITNTLQKVVKIFQYEYYFPFSRSFQVISYGRYFLAIHYMLSRFKAILTMQNSVTGIQSFLMAQNEQNNISPLPRVAILLCALSLRENTQ
jgi:hypothetical protein